MQILRIPIPLQMRLSCETVNLTSGEALRSRECKGKRACDLGPLNITHCDGSSIQLTFCGDLPDTTARGRKRMKQKNPLSEVACSLQSNDGTVSKTEECAGKNASCSLGPLTFTFKDIQVQAKFCEKPPPQGGCKWLPKKKEKKERPGPGVCMVVGADGTETNTKHACPSEVGCTVGPLVIETPKGDVERWFCTAEQGKLAKRACNVIYDNGTISKPKPCRRGDCSVGPVEVSLDGQSADVFLCSQKKSRKNLVSDVSILGNGVVCLISYICYIYQILYIL